MDPAARIAVWTDSYRAALRATLETASAQRFACVAINTARGDFDPRTFARTARRHLATVLRSLGLRLGMLCLELPGYGLADSARADEAFARLTATLEIARELASERAGVTLAGLDDPRRRELAREVLAHAAGLADHHRVVLSVFDRSAGPQTLAAIIQTLDCPFLRVGLDAAYCPQPPDAAVLAHAGDVFLDARAALRQPAPSFAAPPARSLSTSLSGLAGLAAALSGTDADPLWILRHDDPHAPVDDLPRAREHVATLLRRG